jgi:hypothetical protein
MTEKIGPTTIRNVASMCTTVSSVERFIPLKILKEWFPVQNVASKIPFFGFKAIK